MPKFSIGDKLQDRSMNDPYTIEDVTPEYYFVRYQDGSTNNLSFRFIEVTCDAQLVTPEVVDKYTVRANELVLETFTDLEKARFYRDGYNKAIDYWADSEYNARITIDVEEVQTVTVTVTKDVD